MAGWRPGGLTLCRTSRGAKGARAHLQEEAFKEVQELLVPSGAFTAFA